MMCGIAGIVTEDASSRTLDLLTKMMEALKHRGPDDDGIFHSKSLAIGFRRLSIIDLPGGHQPMRSPDGRFTIMLNGEIYNFPELRKELQERYCVLFHTSSDTEVALYAYQHWGLDALSRFNGMFALAIWDDIEQHLTLARDPFGMKPLYYHNYTKGFLFASEIKALLVHPCCPRRVDRERLLTSITYRYVPDHETCFESISALLPGTWMRVGKSGEIVNKPLAYRNPLSSFDHSSLMSHTTSSAIEQLTDLLKKSVTRQLMADVPVGIFLSGGVDSTLITAIAAESTNNLKTFSAGFESGISEHQEAEDTSDYYGTIHETTMITPSSFLDALPMAIWHRESPVSEPSDIPIFIMSRNAGKYVKVVLSGDGSDEIFGGYSKYAAEHYLQVLPNWLKRNGSRALQKVFEMGSSSPLGVFLASQSSNDFRDRYARWFGAFHKQERLSLLTPELLLLDSRIHETALKHQDVKHRLTSMQLMQHLDLKHWLPANLLLRNDRMTMAHSMELRCPFLDPDLVNFAFQLSDSMKVRNGTTKWILRKAAAGILPSKIAFRKKWGFKVPIEQWFRGPLLPILKDSLLSPEAKKRGYFNAWEVERLLNDHVINGRNHSKQLWHLMQLELWHRTFRLD